MPYWPRFEGNFMKIIKYYRTEKWFLGSDDEMGNDKHLVVWRVITGHKTFRASEQRNLSLAIPYYIVIVFRVVKLYLPLEWRTTIVGGKQYFFFQQNAFTAFRFSIARRHNDPRSFCYFYEYWNGDDDAVYCTEWLFFVMRWIFHYVFREVSGSHKSVACFDNRYFSICVNAIYEINFIQCF